MKKIFGIVLICALLAGMTSLTALGAVVFEDDFSSGTIDSEKWQASSNLSAEIAKVGDKNAVKLTGLGGTKGFLPVSFFLV